MIIKEIGIRGFKSYGNNEQVLKLNTDIGQLILLSGQNGSGKSSLLDSFDFTLFGKVRGKKKKWSTLSNLPNRINGELLNRLKFISNGTEVEIKRGISPNKLELWENGSLNERAGKSNIEERIENYVGMDIETFKSFISMSINDFKNFISLSNEEKKILLDKLFNLEVINILNNILKEINKENKIKISTLESEIRAFEESINSINESIKKSIEKQKLNIQSEIDDLVEMAKSKKEEWNELKLKMSKVKEKENELRTELDSEKRQLINTQNDIKNIDREINLYNSGKCPTCSTDFNTDHFFSLKESLLEKKKKVCELEIEIRNNVKKIIEKQNKLSSIGDKITNYFNDLNYLLKGYKQKVEELKRKKDDKLPDLESIKEFENTIFDIEKKSEESKNKISISKEKELYYKELNRILSEDGVKKSIISGIIKPINHFVSENIKKMGLPFEVNLNESFNAEISTLGNIIEHDSLSTGETKLTNICILVAYLKLIRTKKHINILFLDEVFSSIDIENIDKILVLLKSFSNDYKINIFVVHHAILSQEMFDRIIKIEKNIFSEIIEIKLEDL